MNYFDILGDKILKYGRVGVYFQKNTPYLSLRVTTKQGSPDAEFLKEFVELTELGTIQHLSKSTIFVLTGLNAEKLLATDPDVGGILMSNNPELANIIYEYHVIMESKRNGGVFDINDINDIRDRLKDINGTSRKRKSIDQVERLEITEEDAERFGVDPDFIESVK